MLGNASLAVVIILFLASLILHNSLLFVVSLIMLLATGVAWLWDRYCLTGVEYRRHFSQHRAFFGEEVEITVEVVNRKALPLPWLETEDEFPVGLEPLHAQTSHSHKPNRRVLSSLMSLRWYERVRRHYRIRCDLRGYHVFGPAHLRSGDIFGFNSRDATVEKEDRLLIYPRIVPISQLGLPSKDPFGDMKTRQWIFEDPLRAVGVREYVYGDNPRRIHWKATARTHELQVKLYEPTTNYRLVIFLNLNTYGTFWWWQGFDPDLLELGISAAASVANWSIEQGYQAGICVNGNAGISDQKVKISPSRDPGQLTQILEALARITPFATMPLEALLRLESRDLPYGATIVVITGVVGEEILGELLALKAAGHRVALLLIGDAVSEAGLEGFWTHRIGGEKKWREIKEMAAASAIT